METIELKNILDDLNSSLSNNLKDFVTLEQSKLYPSFVKLIQLICLDNGSFDEKIIKLIDILTDNLDSLNFGLAKENIEEINNLL